MPRAWHQADTIREYNTRECNIPFWSELKNPKKAPPTAAHYNLLWKINLQKLSSQDIFRQITVSKLSPDNNEVQSR